MNVVIPEYIEREVADVIRDLLAKPQENRNDLEQMWFLIDCVWDWIGCDSGRLNWERVARFYSHPVWILNGLFIEQDELSMQHRNAIADWMAGKGFGRVLDFGGGCGTLARLVSERAPHAKVYIYEPHPSSFAIQRLASCSNVSFIDELGYEQYECLVATDVLEHVSDPLRVCCEMLAAVKPGGYLVIANCFMPVIKCHLPQTFHLRYTFNYFARRLGMRREGPLVGSHATIYRKTGRSGASVEDVRGYERVAKALHPILSMAARAKRLLST